MKKLFLICAATCCIFLFSQPTKAGRQTLGNLASPECECGVPSPTPCYDENTWQLCNFDGGLMEEASTAPLLPSETTSDEDASLELTAFVTAYLLWRLI